MNVSSQCPGVSFNISMLRGNIVRPTTHTALCGATDSVGFGGRKLGHFQFPNILFMQDVDAELALTHGSCHI